MTSRPLRVFLCHSSTDKPAVRELYQKLRAEPWIQPWLDEEELYPGDDWDLAIEKAVENSDVILVCLSNGSINKRGYVQKELRFALDIALEIPEETIFIVPLRLEECTPPRSLRDWQYADYFEGQRDRALERLLVSLKRRAHSLDLQNNPGQSADIPDQTKNSIEESNEQASLIESVSISSQEQEDKIAEFEALAVKQGVMRKKVDRAPNKITLSNGMEFMSVPAVKFLMGSTKENTFAYNNERPRHTVDIPYDYWLARYPITNELFNTYVKAKKIKHPVSGWEKKKDHPVVYVKWTDAIEYCQWLNNLLKDELHSGLVLRLPTEAEWERAARGIKRLEYPWGNEFDKNKCNTSESDKKETTSVGLYSPQGDSPYGCDSMAGNVWEWTHSLKKEYPYKVNDGRENEKASGARVLRGGSFFHDGAFARCACRYASIINNLDLIGFRVVVSPPLPK